MFGRKKAKLKQKYDDELLELIYAAKAAWDHARETQDAVYESNVSSELAQQTKLQEQKYLYLYREAQRRRVHGQMQR